MSKFVIECPHCGKYAEARTGFFARKKIDCSCGNTINVRTDRLASRVCPHCGQTVVFDQAKRDKARCPVCHEPINTLSDSVKLEEFSCAQCGVRLQAARGAESYVCPVCDFENDVPERLMSEKIRKDGLASIIKYEGDNETLIWKHPIEDFNMGSQLIVHESQEAVFFRDGQALDLFGAGRYTLETQQLPILEKFYKLPTDTEGTFHSEVYYINMATQMGIKWGTDSKVRLFDPASGLHVELGASGEFNIRVTDSRRLLLKVVGTAGALGQTELLGTGNGKGFFRAMVMTQVKSFLAQTIKENSIGVLEIDEHLMTLSNALRNRINIGLAEYGLTMPEFYVSRVVTPDDDPNFRRMKEQYAEQYLLVRQEQIKKSEAEAAQARKMVEAETAAKMKIIAAQGSAEAYRVQAQAEAEEMKMKGYTYQQETARRVGLEAMKNGITSNGSGGGISDVASLGVTLGAMGGVIGMTKDALTPIIGSSSEIGKAVADTVKTDAVPATDTWDCECGQKSITSKFCPECGKPRPIIQKAIDTWNCIKCGTKGLTSKFCPECGAKRPEGSSTWDCPECGKKGIISKFCPECGHKREN